MTDQAATWAPGSFLSPAAEATASHLSPVAGLRLLAWATKHDVCAGRTEAGEEVLYVAGKPVPLDLSREVHPTQQVIALAWLSKQRQKRQVAEWAADAERGFQVRAVRGF